MITIHQTDRQTTCDRNTALCTKVHRAVKTAHITTVGRTLITSEVVNAVCTPLLQLFDAVWIRESFLDVEEEPDL